MEESFVGSQSTQASPSSSPEKNTSKRLSVEQKKEKVMELFLLLIEFDTLCVKLAYDTYLRCQFLEHSCAIKREYHSSTVYVLL